MVFLSLLREKASELLRRVARRFIVLSVSANEVAPFAVTPASIPTPSVSPSPHIPPEIIFQILEHLLETPNELSKRRTIFPYHGRRETFEPHLHYPDLLAASLVSRAWTRPAQELLWRFVDLKSDEHVQRWIKSPTDDECATEWLSIKVRDPGDAHPPLSGWPKPPSVSRSKKLAVALTTLAVQRARGLETLRLRDCVLDIEGLCRPELAGITTLALYASPIDPSPTSSSALPFSLSTLILSSSPLPPPLLTSLLSSPLLTSLSLLEAPSTNPFTSLPSLPALTALLPLLTTLHLSHPAPLLPLLPLLTSLTTLILSRSIPPPLVAQTLAALPSRLRVLGLEDSTYTSWVDMECGNVGLEALEEVWVPWLECRVVEYWGAYMHPRELYAKGVRVRYVLEW